jgi:hypothetical protein
VFEELGPDFTLLAFGAEDGLVEAFALAARRLNVPLKIVRDTRDGGREAYEATFILIRPDQYVAWAGDVPADDPGAMIRAAVGR